MTGNRIIDEHCDVEKTELINAIIEIGDTIDSIKNHDRYIIIKNKEILKIIKEYTGLDEPAKESD